MKKIMTLLLITVLTVTITFAQNALLQKPYTLPIDPKSPQRSQVNHITKNNNSRSVLGSCDTVFMDYTSYNAQVAANTGLNFNGSIASKSLYGAALTSFVDTFHQGQFRYVESVFDSLAFTDNSPSGLGYFPLAKSTVFFDSLSFYISLNGNLAKMRNDSLVFSIFSITGTTFSPAPVQVVVLHDTADLAVYNVGATSFRFGTVPVRYQFTKGQGFAVVMQYLGKDTSTHCNFAYSFADSCGTLTVPGIGTFQSPAYLSPLSVLTPSGYIPVSSYGIVVKDANNKPIVRDENNFWSYQLPSSVPVNCTWIFYQNIDIFPIITVCTDYAAKVSADKSRGCPGSTINLTSVVFGTRSANITYDWSVNGSGTLTSNNTDANSLVLGASGNVTVTLSVNDGTNVTTDSVVISNAGINISVTNATQPIPVNCGGLNPVTVITNTTGTPVAQQGKAYKWSTAATTSTISVKTAGTYTVTVTNNTGCTAATSVEVVYSNGTTNNVNFNNPVTTPPRPANSACVGQDAVFTNTSTKFAAPWVAHWDFVGDGQNIYDITNGASTATNIYLTAGVVHPILKMDSAGCTFSSASKTLTVLSATSATCIIGIQDVEFENAVSVIPNPSNGNVNITINGIEKNVSIKVFSIIGDEVKFFAATDMPSVFSKTFDFSDLASGAYLLKIQSGDRTAVKRLLISK